MSTLDEDLRRRLDAIKRDGLYRQLRVLETAQGPHIRLAGQSLINFSSNDYLGLTNHPAVKEAAQRAIETHGAGAGSSRLLCGSLQPHGELEERLSAFKGVEAALTFSSGYSAALGLIDALLEKEDILICDKLVHACLVDSARLCRAKLRLFPHNDLDALEKILKSADSASPKVAGHRPRKLIVTESVFSMDGDLCPLREIVQLKEKHGAWLLLDEAHATGLFGQNRRGLAEAFGLADQVDIQMGTLGKALASAGGYFCGSRGLVDFLINKARSFIFSTAPPPASVAAARAALDVIESQEGQERRSHLWARVDDLKNGLIIGKWTVPPVRSAIIPLIIGSEQETVALADQLRGLGLFTPAIRYPTVARGTARLRLTVSASHNSLDIAALLGGLAVCRSRAERQLNT